MALKEIQESRKILEEEVCVYPSCEGHSDEGLRAMNWAVMAIEKKDARAY